MYQYISLFFFFFFFFFILHGFSACDLEFPIGRQIAIPFPSTYEDGFKASAAFLGSDDSEMKQQQQQPSFKAALSLEGVNGAFSCALVVLLGDVKVWASDHRLKFWADGACVMELTQRGDLQVKDRTGRVGWRSGTFGLSIKSLKLQQKSGNLLLRDAENRTRWQSFDFPTDRLLWSQQLNASTSLTNFMAGTSAMYYSFEVHSDKLALYLNFKDQKYLYWELKPPSNASISRVRLGSRGLKLFNRKSKKIGQILAPDQEKVRYLALGITGNLQLYYASKSYTNLIVFESSYEAIQNICDLPLPCGLYRVCTFSYNSTCLDMPRMEGGYTGFCDNSYNSEMQMVELQAADTVLRTERSRKNSTKEECVSSCMDDCLCAAALHTKQECFQYGLAAGAREARGRAESSYWVKVPKDTDEHGISSRLVNIFLLLGEIVNIIAICCILGGIWYWILRIRQNRRENSGTNSS